MNIISVTVGASMLGVLAPGVMQMSIAPMVAQVRANNFAVAEAQAVTFADAATLAYDLPVVPSICSVNSEQTEVSCTVGDGKYRMVAKRSFRLMDSGGTPLGVYSDDDRDGFDDKTGMMTHYAECYSGWKGSATNTLKNNCTLGGKYVIPAYAILY